MDDDGDDGEIALYALIGALELNALAVLEERMRSAHSGRLRSTTVTDADIPLLVAAATASRLVHTLEVCTFPAFSTSQPHAELVCRDDGRMWLTLCLRLEAVALVCNALRPHMCVPALIISHKSIGAAAAADLAAALARNSTLQALTLGDVGSMRRPRLLRRRWRRTAASVR